MFSKILVHLNCVVFVLHVFKLIFGQPFKPCAVALLSNSGVDVVFLEIGDTQYLLSFGTQFDKLQPTLCFEAMNTMLSSHVNVFPGNFVCDTFLSSVFDEPR